MAEEVKTTEAAPAAITAAVELPVVQSPPAAPVPTAPTAARNSDEPRLRLHQVAAALSRGLNRQLLAEYLQLRRVCRQ